MSSGLVMVTVAWVALLVLGLVLLVVSGRSKSREVDRHLDAELRQIDEERRRRADDE